MGRLESISCVALPQCLEYRSVLGVVVVWYQALHGLAAVEQEFWLGLRLERIAVVVIVLEVELAIAAEVVAGSDFSLDAAAVADGIAVVLQPWLDFVAAGIAERLKVFEEAGIALANHQQYLIDFLIKGRRL